MHDFELLFEIAQFIPNNRPTKLSGYSAIEVCTGFYQDCLFNKKRNTMNKSERKKIMEKMNRARIYGAKKKIYMFSAGRGCLDQSR